MRNVTVEPTSRPPYFVAATNLGKANPTNWAETQATTLDGAKRLAAKLPRGLTTTAMVALRNTHGDFETLASLTDYSAITRRRPVWQTHQLSKEKA